MNSAIVAIIMAAFRVTDPHMAQEILQEYDAIDAWETQGALVPLSSQDWLHASRSEDYRFTWKPTKACEMGVSY